MSIAQVYITNFMTSWNPWNFSDPLKWNKLGPTNHGCDKSACDSVQATFHGVMGSSSSWLGFTGFTNVLKAQRIKTIPLDCWLVPKLSSSIPIAMSWTAGFQLITVSGYSDNGTSSNCLPSFDIYICIYQVSFFLYSGVSRMVKLYCSIGTQIYYYRGFKLA